LFAFFDIDANEFAQNPDLRTPGIANYFGLKLWLVNQDEGLILCISSCGCLSDVQMFFTWFDPEPKD